MSTIQSLSRTCLLAAFLVIAGCGRDAHTKLKVVNLSDWYRICVNVPEQAVQKVHPRGIDSDIGELSLDGTSVKYHVGFGLQGDFKYGRRIDLPYLSHGKAQVFFWEDPELSAVVVEGLKTDGARAHVWYVFDGSSAKSRSFAEQLARKTDYCDLNGHREWKRTEQKTDQKMGRRELSLATNANHQSQSSPHG